MLRQQLPPKLIFKLKVKKLCLTGIFEICILKSLFHPQQIYCIYFFSCSNKIRKMHFNIKMEFLKKKLFPEIRKHEKQLNCSKLQKHQKQLRNDKNLNFFE